MDSRLANWILLGLNLAFAAIIAVLALLLQQSRQAPPRFLAAPLPSSGTVTQIAVRKINATNLLALLASRQLSWANLESTNYFVYRDNLRRFGVPEETIRDLIVADVAKLYAQRRAELLAQVPPPKFWQTGEAWESRGLTPELRAQLRALDQEEQDLIRELLGVDLKTELAKYAQAEQPPARRFDFLPAEKRDRLAALLDHYEAETRAVHDRAQGLLLDEDLAALRQLEQARQAELAQLLTPEELEEYQVRYSPVAEALRAELDGFEPTEEEFRKLFRLRQTFEEQFGQAFDPADAQQMEIRERAREEAEQALQEEIKQVLGESRFAQYQRASDSEYQTLTQLARRLNLPAEMANRVYDMKAAAEKQKEAIEANSSLTDAQRQAALRAIAQETEKSLAQVMGEKAFQAYRKAGAEWLNDLAVSFAPEPPPVQTVPQAVPVPVIVPPGFPPPPPGLFLPPPELPPAR